MTNDKGISTPSSWRQNIWTPVITWTTIKFDTCQCLDPCHTLGQLSNTWALVKTFWPSSLLACILPLFQKSCLPSVGLYTVKITFIQNTLQNNLAFTQTVQNSDFRTFQTALQNAYSYLHFKCDFTSRHDNVLRSQIASQRTTAS